MMPEIATTATSPLGWVVWIGDTTQNTDCGLLGAHDAIA